METNKERNPLIRHRISIDSFNFMYGTSWSESSEFSFNGHLATITDYSGSHVYLIEDTGIGIGPQPKLNISTWRGNAMSGSPVIGGR